MLTGLSQDAMLERGGSGAAGITVASKRLHFAFDTNNTKAYTLMAQSPSIDGTQIIAIGAHISLSASPTAEIGLTTDAAQASTQRLFRIGTDRKIRAYDYLGNAITGAVSTTAVSTVAGSPTEIVYFVDPITRSTVWVRLYVNGSEEFAVDTGLSWANYQGGAGNIAWYTFGDWTPAGSNFGATMDAQYVVMRISTSASDSPHLVQYPRLKAVGGMDLPPTSEGDAAQWANGTTASPNTFQDVDETGGNDGDTSYIRDARTGTTPALARFKHLFHFSAANPFAGTETIDWVQLRHDGALNSAGKHYANPMMKLAGTEAEAAYLVAVTTNYGPNGAVFDTTPAGGAWATTDFNLTGGVSDLQFGGWSKTSDVVDTGPKWTLVLGPEGIYHTASLPLGTAPPASTRRRFGAII